MIWIGFGLFALGFVSALAVIWTIPTKQLFWWGTFSLLVVFLGAVIAVPVSYENALGRPAPASFLAEGQIYEVAAYDLRMGSKGVAEMREEGQTVWFLCDVKPPPGCRYVKAEKNASGNVVLRPFPPGSGSQPAE